MGATTLSPGSGIDLSAPADVLPRWLAAMRSGDFESAWRQTDRIEIPRRRAEAAGTFAARPHHLVWNGTEFDERTVLVRCEHGLGDTIQFIRYLPRVRQRARRVILKVQPALLDLCIAISGADEVRNAWTDAADPPHDVQIECMEFPYAFRDTVTSVPCTVPFLSGDSILRRSKVSVPRDQLRRIGLVWAASNWDDSRSLEVADLAPFTSVPRTAFYSLQQGDQQRLGSVSSLPLIPLCAVTANLLDAAAAMLQLDLIITVDNMTAHLAGALGRPTWVLLKHDADWRWMTQRADTPWYPTMRLFRQPRIGDWGSVMREVVRSLSSDETSRCC